MRSVLRRTAITALTLSLALGGVGTASAGTLAAPGDGTDQLASGSTKSSGGPSPLIAGSGQSCDLLTEAPRFSGTQISSFSRMICSTWLPFISVDPMVQRKRWWGWEDISADLRPLGMYTAVSVGGTSYGWCKSGEVYTYRGKGTFFAQWLDGSSSTSTIYSGGVKYTCP